MKPKKQNKRLSISKATIAKLDNSASSNIIGGVKEYPTTIGSFFTACDTYTSCNLFYCDTNGTISVIQ